MTVVHDNNMWCAWVRIISFMLKTDQFQHSHTWACNGREHVTGWPQMIRMRNPKFKNVRIRCLLLSENFMFLRKKACHWQRCEVMIGILWPCGGLLITGSAAWPYLKIKKNVHNVRLEWMKGVIHAYFQLSIVKKLRSNCEKTGWGWHPYRSGRNSLNFFVNTWKLHSDWLKCIYKL